MGGIDSFAGNSSRSEWVDVFLYFIGTYNQKRLKNGF